MQKTTYKKKAQRKSEPSAHLEHQRTSNKPQSPYPKPTRAEQTKSQETVPHQKDRADTQVRPYVTIPNGPLTNPFKAGQAQGPAPTKTKNRTNGYPP
ncbi:MAG: hypothetical protein O2954_13020, partial [bacterium]|nr:hypothetical protein [bacterium]